MKKPPNGGDCVFCEAVETGGLRVLLRVAVLVKRLGLLLDPLLPCGNRTLEESDQGFV